MKLIDQFLNKYKKLKPINLELNDFLINYFKEKFNLILKKEEIKFQGKIIYFQLPVLIKNELLINKSEVLEKIKYFNSNIKDFKCI